MKNRIATSREVKSESGVDAAKRALLAKLLRREGIALPAREDLALRPPLTTAPLSFAQERLWFLDQLDPGASVYNISRAMRLRGRLDTGALVQSLDAIVQRHEILRSSFRSSEDGPVQEALARISLDVPVIDLCKRSQPARRAELERILTGEANTAFDLAAAPLLRARLIKLGNADHVLLLVLHQLVCDGWSMRLFCRELGIFYRSYVAGRTAVLAELPIQYRDYALRQRELFHSKLLEQQLAYWRERLGDSLPGIALPTDRPRPARQTFHGARLPLSLPTTRVRALRTLGAQEGATLFMTLMAAFNVLLWRYSDQEDISVGFPVARRAWAESQNLIGFFVNTLVLRTALSGDLTFRDLLRLTRENCRGALAHQDLPFDKLVEELARERDLSRNPLFQVMFAYQGDLAAELDLPGIKSVPVEIAAATAKFDLTLTLTEHNRGLSGFLEYSSDLFDRSTITRMAGHFLTLLGGITNDPDRPIGALPLLAKAERKQILVDWNDTAADYPKHRCMHELFEAQARKTPDATAVQFAGEHWTYGELNGRAERLARHLQSLGVGAESLVGVCVERSLEMIVGLLGILKAGGAYVPLDPKYPRERIAFMLADAQIDVLLVRDRASANRYQFSDRSMRIVCLDDDWQTMSVGRARKVPRAARSDNLAYVIYTSGSTGAPKGVAIEHRNAVALLYWARSVFSHRELAGVLASTSICFDLSVFEIFVPLSWGGKIILVEDALALRDCAAVGEITLINTVPSAMSEWLATGGLPESVRAVNLAGEPLPTELVRRIYQHGVDQVYDLYGPSETTTYSTFTRRAEQGRATIGRPIANTKIYLLDAALQPVPIGVPGELYIGGAGVARGYWRRPELTTEKFLRDPFSREPGTRMYRSGDLARYLADGNIEYLGRADNQMKVRGYRIEPGEIEAALMRHPAIRECVVIAREEQDDASVSSSDRQPIKQVIGYVVCADGIPPAVDALRSFLRRTLPEYMVPAAFIALDGLPRTPSGKVDRGALPAAATKRPPLSAAFTAPRTEVEELIAQEWRAALKLDRVGAHDNFFDLGGHSLLVMRVAGRLRAHFKIDLALRKLFELPTVAGLAEFIEQLRQNQSGSVIAPVAPVPRKRQIPLSFAQRRLWFLHKVEPGLTAYNMPEVYRIHGALNVVALEAALGAMIERHESLRTIFIEIDGAPVQQIVPAAPFRLPISDWRGRPQREARAETEELIARDARQPHVLGDAPLMRASLLQLEEEEFILLLNFHHIVCDAASLVIFYRELGQLYDGLAARTAANLPTLRVRYADFAAWQENQLSGPALAAQLDYWKARLDARLPSADLPTDFARPPVQTYRGAKCTRRLSRALSAALKAFGRKEGATLFMVLLASLDILLARWSGQQDIVIGSTIAGRTRPEWDGIIGFFINALALRSDLSGAPTFNVLLGRVREVCLGAYTHQDLPFERVVEALNPARDPGRNPIFQVLFNLAERGERELKLSGCQAVKLDTAMAGAKFDLVVQAPQVDGGIELGFIYNADLFTEARIVSMLDQFELLLSQIIADPATPIAGYSLLTPSQQMALPDPRVKLSDAWFGPAHTIISRRAEQRPQAPAIVDDGGTWTYRKLDLGSNRLANCLIAGGIEPGDVVAIYAHRSAALALAILGVLRAGGVFVILDPAYPPARLVDYLGIARPKGWLQMAAAGGFPEEIARWLDATVPLRLTLPDKQKEISAGLRNFSARVPLVTVDADSPAYLAFTSGSTGQPKGVLCRHGPMTHFLPWQEEAFALRSSDRYALLSGLAYNHLQRDLFTALASGATLYVPNPDCLKEPNRLVDWLREHAITILHLTPALGRMLETAKGKSLPSVRRIFCGGDLLSRQDIRSMRELAPNAEIVSFYGATETQRAVGYFAVSEDQPQNEVRAKSSMPTGRGAPDVQLLLLTPSGQLAGVGEVGELYVRSPHLAAGYIDDDALTESNFPVNPFTRDKSDRLFRTGDLGRYLPDGNVEWTGRIDRRVSIRGFRIELAEVEAALRQCAGVRAAAVIADEFFSGSEAECVDTRLIAYLEIDTRSAVSIGEVRRLLGAKLPHYMVPAYFRKLARLPLNPNGKIDYFSLSAQGPFIDDRDAAFEAPFGEMEQRLEVIFAQLLGVASIGRRDNFFALGGHSLLAAQAAARIRESLGIDLELRSFMEAPTIEALGRRIEALRSSADAAQGADREEIEL